MLGLRYQLTLRRRERPGWPARPGGWPEAAELGAWLSGEQGLPPSAWGGGGCLQNCPLSWTRAC